MKQCKISIYISRLPFPLSFAVHSRIVLESTETERYEIHRHNNIDGTYLFYNNQPASQGMHKKKWKTNNFGQQGHHHAKLISVYHCDKDLIIKCKDLIEGYKYKQYYRHFPGPNSNSFTQYIIDQLQLPTQLPRNAFGSGYQSHR